MVVLRGLRWMCSVVLVCGSACVPLCLGLVEHRRGWYQAGVFVSGGALLCSG
jgi:hypothetical protein